MQNAHFEISLEVPGVTSANQPTLVVRVFLDAIACRQRISDWHSKSKHGKMRLSEKDGFKSLDKTDPLSQSRVSNID
jgi:hypothetical protein